MAGRCQPCGCELASEEELGEKIIIRLPLVEAKKVRELLQTKPEELREKLKIDINAVTGTGFVFFENKKFYAYVNKLHTIKKSNREDVVIDSYFFKSADVGCVLECFEMPLEKINKETEEETEEGIDEEIGKKIEEKIEDDIDEEIEETILRIIDLDVDDEFGEGSQRMNAEN